MTRAHLSLAELSAFLDGEFASEEELVGSELARDHFKSCARCSDALASLQALRRTAREAAPEVPTDELWGDLLARLEALPASPPSLLERLRRLLAGAGP